MAYRLYRAGKLTNAKAHGSGRQHRPVGAYCGIAVYADTVEDYVNNEFYYALQYWQMTKMWGLANGNNGWANESFDYIDAITALESEHNAMENEAMEEASSKHGKMKNVKGAKAGKVSGLLEE